MKNVMIIITLITMAAVSVPAQRVASDGLRNTNTNTKMLYHGGPLMFGTSDLYLIWYGCWTNVCGNSGSPVTTDVVTLFAQGIGGSPYFQLNHLYVNANGQGPSGGLLHGGSIFDSTYSHGLDLTQADIEDIVTQKIESNALPQDPGGLYIVIASADVASNATGFCSPENVPPLHWRTEALGSMAIYGFLGNPKRCPTLEAPQFTTTNGALLPTPNDDFAGDSIVTNLAHLLNAMVSDPYKNAWYDRYGLENADKCQGTFGQTWTASNGARANIRLSGRDYLIGQNWVNDKNGRCGMQWGR